MAPDITMGGPTTDLPDWALMLLELHEQAAAPDLWPGAHVGERWALPKVRQLYLGSAGAKTGWCSDIVTSPTFGVTNLAPDTRVVVRDQLYLALDHRPTCQGFDVCFARKLGAPDDAVADGVMVKLNEGSLWFWAGMKASDSHFHGAGPAWTKRVHLPNWDRMYPVTAREDALLARATAWRMSV